MMLRSCTAKTRVRIVGMCLARVAGKLGMTTDATPFVPAEDADWNDDGAVLRHELGHALVWFVHGGGLGRLRLARANDGLLEAGVVTGPRPGQTDTPAFIDSTAERLLAGEAAARRHLGIPGGRISLRGLQEPRLPAGARPDEIAAAFAEVGHASDGRVMLGDVAKILSLADQYHQADWRTWIRERLAAAEHILSTQWAVLGAVAVRFERGLPRRPRQEVVVSAQDLIAAFESAGAKPTAEGPVAI